MYPKIHIVIVGGGFGGIACARACAHTFSDAPHIEITLIASRPYQEFHAGIYAGASEINLIPHPAVSAAGHRQNGDAEGAAPPRVPTEACPVVRYKLNAARCTACRASGLPDGAREAGHAVRKALCLPLHLIFSRTKLKIVYGWVERIDNKERMIFIRHHAPQRYSYLVLALGSETDYCNIPGLAAHAYPLKTVKDALRVRQVLENALSKPGGRIIVGGGGFTGAEIAAELGWIVRKKKIDAQVALIEGMTPVLSQLGDSASITARTRLMKLGIVLRGGARIASVTEKEGGGVAIHLDTHETMEGDALIWTGGVRGNRLYQQMFPLSVSARGRVSVEETLQVAGEKRVFAVGDGAYLVTDEYAYGLPMQAWMAIAEGEYVADNIIRLIHGMEIKPFLPPSLPFAVPLGGRYGIVVWRGKVWRGFFPWVLKQLKELQYYTGVLGWNKGFALWVREERMCVSE